MTIDPTPRPTAVTVVHSPACHFCDDAHEVLVALSTEYPLDLSVVGIDSPEGAELIAQHRPAMNPLVLVDGAYFSAGRLPRKKLVAALQARGARRPATAGR